MSEFLPKDLRDELAVAQKDRLRKRSRMRVRTGGQTFTILRHWKDGFSLDSADAPHLRGLVDLYDGATHVKQCLIVASTEENGETVYEYKRGTPVADRAPLDYSRDKDAPTALIESN